MVYQVQYNIGTTKSPRWVLWAEFSTRSEANSYLNDLAQAQYAQQAHKTVSLNYFAQHMRVKGRRV